MIFGARGVSRYVEAANYAEAVLFDAPVHYWRFGETSGSVAYDDGSSPVNLAYIAPGAGTYLDQGALVTGGNSVLFSYVAAAIGAKTSQELGSESLSSVTYEAVYKGSSYINRVFMKEAGATNGIGFGFYNNSLRFGKRSSGTGVFADYPVSNLSSSETYHLAGVWDGTNKRVSIFVNGTEVASNTWTSFSEPSSTAYFTVGTSSNGPSGCGDVLANSASCNYFNGQLAEIAIYNKVLSASRIEAHFNASGI